MNLFRRASLTTFLLLTAGVSLAQQTYWGTETTEAQQLSQQLAAKRGSMGMANKAMVAACHNRSVDIGVDILKRGGSAADAFIAVSLADYVQAPGTSSLGGPLGAVVYDARRRRVKSVMAPLKTVAAVEGQWRANETALGKQVLVPGAIAGLERLHREQGKLPWKELVEPARRLAAEGFEVDFLYGVILSNYLAVATRTPYGKATYLRADGKPYAAGQTIKLPALAATLAQIRDQGAAALYRGEWAKQAVALIAEHGGRATLADFASYRPTWDDALHIRYRGHDVYGPAGSDNGGLRLLLALQALGNADLTKHGHYSESLDGLEILLRTVQAVNAEPRLYSHAFINNAAEVRKLLDGNRAAEIWREVEAKIVKPAPAPAGSHSYSVVVVDEQGNAVAGTHTIEGLPFGSGLFVGGVPLNNTGILHPYTEGVPYSTPPGAYLVEPLSATIALRETHVVLASSTFSSGLWPADLQVAISALDFDWSPERIALTPRFGSYALDFTTMTADPTKTVIDKRYHRSVLDALGERGIKLSSDGYVDTGMIVAVKRDAAGKLTGFTPELLIDGKAMGY